MAQMEEVDIFARHRRAVEAEFPGLAGRRALYETSRRMITAMTADVVATSSERIAALPVLKKTPAGRVMRAHGAGGSGSRSR